MSSISIYALNDPRTGKTRYIGATSNIGRRLREHVAGCATESSGKGEWIRALLAEGHYPQLLLIDTVDERNSAVRERAWIRRYRESGFDLLNDLGGPMEYPTTAAGRQEAIRLVLVEADFPRGTKKEIAIAAGVRREQISRELTGFEGLRVRTVIAALPFLSGDARRQIYGIFWDGINEADLEVLA